MCIPPLHTIKSLLPIFQLLFFQHFLQTSQVWKIRHPHSHSIELLSQLSTIPIAYKKITQQTTEIDYVTSHRAEKYAGIKFVKLIFKQWCETQMIGTNPLESCHLLRHTWLQRQCWWSFQNCQICLQTSSLRLSFRISYNSCMHSIIYHSRNHKYSCKRENP